jgi:hypothetical protein
MPVPEMSAPLAGGVSIDATTPDGYLDNARVGTPTARAHRDTQTAAANLLAFTKGPSQSSTASLVGHGAPGIFATGGGGSGGTSLQRIVLDNQNVWAPLLEPLSGRIGTLYLFGPQVGAGIEGAQLLHALARVTNATVCAPTGLIYCDNRGNFRLQVDSVWQAATPEMLPPPIWPPSLQPSSLAASPPSGQSGARIGACAAFGSGGVPLPRKSALALASQVRWDQPFQESGKPAAMVTGRLRASFGGTAMRSFTILNNALVRDDADPTRFYPVGPAFRAIALGR